MNNKLNFKFEAEFIIVEINLAIIQLKCEGYFFNPFRVARHVRGDKKIYSNRSHATYVALRMPLRHWPVSWSIDELHPKMKHI